MTEDELERRLIIAIGDSFDYARITSEADNKLIETDPFYKSAVYSGNTFSNLDLPFAAKHAVILVLRLRLMGRI